ncbi:MAG: hypothetical protein RLZZ53_943 [Acidobacteriota bacterium]|jgi:hypothetical protein
MGLWEDLRFAGRLLLKDKWFSLVAAIALALGIGVNATVFTFVNAVLIRGLPIADPDRTMAIDSYNRVRNNGLGVFNDIPTTIIGVVPEGFRVADHSPLDLGAERDGLLQDHLGQSPGIELPPHRARRKAFDTRVSRAPPDGVACRSCKAGSLNRVINAELGK